MVETALSTPDPDDDDPKGIDWEAFQAAIDKRMPGAKLIDRRQFFQPDGQMDVTEFVDHLIPGFTNGRLGEPGSGHWGHDVIVPPKVDPLEYANWRKRVRFAVRKKKTEVKGIPNRIKALPSQAKEYLRWRVHDYLIGWVLDLNEEPWARATSGKSAPEDDVFLGLS